MPELPKPRSGLLRSTPAPNQAPPTKRSSLTDTQLAAGTYEVLRNRLSGAATDLRERLKRLNVSRAEVFGNIETKLLATERVSTNHNCVPRDILSVGDSFLLGYNVQFGLKSDIEMADVFSVYQMRDHQFHPQALDLIDHKRFHDDFRELYRFYKDTKFQRFFTIGPLMHMVFRVGKTPRDIKTFKWRIDSGALEYLDNRSEHEVKDPAQHEFRWIRTTRDQHHYGAHPHISIEDRVFVEAVGGDLTIKVENNTNTGAGVYAEPVDHADQTLDDAEIHYAVLGNLILLKIRPYQESQFRFVLFNAKIQKAMRLDEIEHACVMLPGDQGLIFPGGYYLQTGEFKRFDHGLSDMRYQRTLAAANGEDFLYLFHNHDSGNYVQLRYNLIRQTVETPLICHGQTLFEGGEMVCFKTQDEPQKHHAIQIWQTPFTGPEVITSSQPDSLLFKIGNKDVVRGMAECSELLQLIDKDDNYDGLYVDLAKKSGDILDAYFWIDKPEAEQLSEPLGRVREAAIAAVEEFDKVLRVRRETNDRSEQVRLDAESLGKEIERGRFESIDDFVAALAKLRTVRGQAISLRELRYVDESLIERLETETAERAERLSRRCVDFLLAPGALDPYRERIEALATAVTEIVTVAEAKKLEKRTDEASSQLELLTETVSNLKIDDATKRTEIIDSIGDVFTGVNRVRSSLKARVSDLMRLEGQAEFASQLKLLQQTTSGYLDVSETPEKCDEYLTKVMVQLEELEGRFAEFDEFVVQLAERREEVYGAFESRKVALVEKRNRRAESLASAADRILKGIQSRAGSMKSPEEIASYFAGDLMVDKVRDIVAQLESLDDAVRAEDLTGRVKTIREDAVRQLKDRLDLFEGGGDLIRFGKHKFAVNTQPLDLTTVVRDGELCMHLTGTQYFEPIKDADLLAARSLWNQEWISESAEVYRAEFLAVSLFDDHRSRGEPLDAAMITPAWVQSQSGGRFEEGYAKGVHDADAAQLLKFLVETDATVDLLAHRPSLRVASSLLFYHLVDETTRTSMVAWVAGFAHLASIYPGVRPVAEFRKRLAEIATESLPMIRGLFADDITPQRIAEYLFDELAREDAHPVVSRTALDLYQAFATAGTEIGRNALVQSLSQVTKQNAVQGFSLACNAADAFLALAEREGKGTGDGESPLHYRDELAWLIFNEGSGDSPIKDAVLRRKLSGIIGNHALISGGAMDVHYHELLSRVRHYMSTVVPAFRRLHQIKSRLIHDARESMRLHEFKPKVLTSFVRNRLIDEVYLPLIGDNLAKQMGAAGEGKRTDRMGLLLLISPPGYGKTTLMEYVANRLGIVFMKINGPAIGHGVTSLDPDEAPNAAAREEIQRLNLALEMGDNVMLYLDDIQHTHPELLQKFISLCDGTRKIEGVRHGKSRTYDLRGRRVAVVMAGNPYTESGDRFQIPDMLSNRADVYNLGEIIGDASDAFEMSYLENCLTSNATLAPLSTASQEDSRALIRAAGRGSLEGIELKGNLSLDAAREMVEVLEKLTRVRDVVLKVNRAYIRSAAQADAYRTEPPFKLQGSYRNMNRIAERVASVMNDAELQSLIVSSYEQEAQTLTTDNEANLLKFKELLGTMTPQDQQRWEAIKYAFIESTRMAGMTGDDSAAQLMRQLASMRDGLESIRQTIAKAIAAGGEATEARMDERVESLRHSVTQAGVELVESLRTTGKTLEQISQQQALQPPDQKVIVQHRIPRVLVELVQGQFHLMQEWLRPILSESVDTSRDVDRMRQQLEKLLATYSEAEAAIRGSLRPQDIEES